MWVASAARLCQPGRSSGFSSAGKMNGAIVRQPARKNASARRIMPHRAWIA